MDELENDVFSEEDYPAEETILSSAPSKVTASRLSRADGNVGYNTKNMPLVLRRSSTQIVIKQIPTKINAQSSKKKIRTLSSVFEDNNSLSKEDSLNDEEHVSAINGVSWLLSGLYAMQVLILTLVLCVTHFITEDISQTAIDSYFIALYVIGILWFICFQLRSTSCCRKTADFEHITSNHTTNRWLKSIVVVFGLAIIIKNMMEFLSLFQMSYVECKLAVFYITPVAQGIFVLAEVNFIFRHSKICMHKSKFMNRFGAMHVIATNLSLWMIMIVNEAVHILHITGHDSYNEYFSTSYTPHPENNLAENGLLNHTDADKLLAHLKPNSKAADSEAVDVCTCNTSYCDAVSTASAFLYPFEIEYSLIASCMVYIVWKHVGNVPPPCEEVTKPSYKFFKSYKGFVGGGIILIATIVILVILSTMVSGIPEAEKTYETEKTSLIIHNTFLVTVEISMILCCIVGVILFSKDPRPMVSESLVNLDVVLLLVGISGSVIIDTFYILAVYASLNEHNWIWGSVYPVTDLLQCVIQVAFVVFGMAREPLTSTESKETVKNFRRTFDRTKSIALAHDVMTSAENMRARASVANFYENECFDLEEFEQQRCNREYNDVSISKELPGVDRASTGISRLESASSVRKTRTISSKSSKAENDTTIAFSVGSSSNAANGESDGIYGGNSNNINNNNKLKFENEKLQENSMKYNEICSCRLTGPDMKENGLGRQGRVSTRVSFNAANEYTNGGTQMGQISGENLYKRRRQSVIAVVAKSKVAKPNKIRLYTRDLLMYLLIANACMWVFWSLDGIAFHLLTYPKKFYDFEDGRLAYNVWTTINMICLPLSIFFRMHSSACIFEVWSFA